MSKRILENIIVLLVASILAGGIFLYVRGRQKQPPLSNVKQAETSNVQVEPPTSGSYRLVTEKSVLEWSGGRYAGIKSTGKVDISNGVLNFDQSGPSTGEFTIDMNTVTESKNHEELLSLIRSNDFFGVKEFPTSKFSITKIEMTPIDDELYKVMGDLTIRDKTNEIFFFARTEFVKGEVRVSAKFKIDRTRWDMTFDSVKFFPVLGERAIKDDIDINLSLVFRSVELMEPEAI